MLAEFDQIYKADLFPHISLCVSFRIRWLKIIPTNVSSKDGCTGLLFCNDCNGPLTICVCNTHTDGLFLAMLQWHFFCLDTYHGHYPYPNHAFFQTFPSPSLCDSTLMRKDDILAAFESNLPETELWTLILSRSSVWSGLKSIICFKCGLKQMHINMYYTQTQGNGPLSAPESVPTAPGTH